LTDSKRQDLATRFKKTADGVYVEAKRSAIGGMTQVPLYFYGLLLALGWNEIVAGESSFIQTRGCESSMLLTLLVNSTAESSLLHLPYPSWSRSVRHLHAQPLGPDAADDERG